MTDRLAGKTALLTGAARGQGRSHALQFAREGADIVAIDSCTSIDTISYPMATPEDLSQTVTEIEDLGRKVLPIQADVRDPQAMSDATEQAITEFGKLDVVVANAGVCAMADKQPVQAWVDVSGVNFSGVLNTLNAAIPHLREGASMIVISSLAALIPGAMSDQPGGMAYSWSKRALVPLVHDLARVLGKKMIRLNGVHPGNTNTDMLQHEDMYKTFRPDLEHPTKEDATQAFASLSAMKTPWVEPGDITNLVTFLASNEARWITGQFIACDAGGQLKL